MAGVTLRRIYSLLLAVFIGGHVRIAALVQHEEHRLHRDVLNGSNNIATFLPVEKPTDVVNVTFSFELINIVKVDAKQQFITVYGSIYQSWVNPHLKWNKTEYGGIDVIYIEPKNVWVPDTILYYNIEEDAIKGGRTSFKTNVVLHSNGKNVWLSPGLFKSICKVNVRYFPLDSQNCSLTFGSWTLDSNRLNYLPRRGMKFPSVYYIKNGEWAITKLTMKRYTRSYQCCENPFVDITITIDMNREYLDYFINLIIPCCLISSMIFLGFVLPPESGERVGLSITVLLAMTVFQQLTSELMPSYDIPLLGKYYFCIILEIGVSILVTTVILNFYHRTHRKMPPWLDTIVLKWLASLVFLKKDAHNYKVAEEKRSQRGSRNLSKRRKTSHFTRYQRSVKTSSNSPEEDGDTEVGQDYLFNDADAINTEIREVGRGTSFCMKNYSLQFGNINPREHSGRESAEEKQVHDDNTDPSDNEMTMRHWQWTLAARTLDRIFLVIAILCGIVTVCAVFLGAPNIWHGKKELDKGDPKLIFSDEK